nr:MAG: nucleocapsid [Bole Tick Virus 2]
MTDTETVPKTLSAVETAEERKSRLLASDPRPRPRNVRIHRGFEDFQDVQLSAHTDKDEVEYPSRYFRAHPGKPIFKYAPTGMTYEHLKGAAYKCLFGSAYNQAVVVEFLIKTYQDIKYVLPDIWISYSVVIGEKGQEITPLSIVHLQEAPTMTTGTQATTDIEPLNLVYLMASLYRLSIMKARQATPEYMRDVRTRLKTLATGRLTADQLRALDEHSTCIDGWHQDASIRTLMAILDMFIRKSKLDTLTPIRIGTLVCRGRDCAVLGDLTRLQEITGFSTEQVVSWLFASCLLKEIEGLTHPGEEYWDPDGYFYYFSDLGLSKKSPFSGSANPMMHFILNTIAFFLGGTAAPNTRFIDCAKVPTLFHAGLLAAFALRRPDEIRPIATTSEAEAIIAQNILQNHLPVLHGVTEAAAEAVDTDDLPEPHVDPPKGQDWSQWVTYYEVHEWAILPPIRDWAQKFATPSTAFRQGSIGQKIRELISTLP